MLIIGDDHGYPYFGFMGSELVHTPHMDALAAGGAVFPNGYVSDNHCRPSLQTLLTGNYPIQRRRRVESLLDAERRADPDCARRLERARRLWEARFRHRAMRRFDTLPRMLAKAGYASFQAGKWWEFSYATAASPRA